MKAIALRLCGAEDAPALRRLADLDSAAPLSGAVLAAEEDGELRAAIGLAGRHVIADPFHRTADLVELLSTRAAQLDPPREGHGGRLGTRLWRLRVDRARSATGEGAA